MESGNKQSNPRVKSSIQAFKGGGIVSSITVSTMRSKLKQWFSDDFDGSHYTRLTGKISSNMSFSSEN